MKQIRLLALFGLVLGVMLAGCGGGGGSQAPAATVSGVAAAGAPIIGYAYLKDSTGKMLGPKDIATDGSFSFDVTGLTAPFILKAEGNAGGQGYELHSVAIGTGTANINPLTNLITAAATGGKEPSALFGSKQDGAKPDLASVNQASVDAAVADVKKTLSTLLANFQVDTTNFDPIKATYVADPGKNKLDALFDVVKIQVAAGSGGTATINVVNKLDNSIILDTSADKLGSATTTNTNIPSSAQVTQLTTETQEITKMLTDWVNVINAKGTAITNADVDKFYFGTDVTFGLQQGLNRTQHINDFLSTFQQARFAARGQLTTISNFSIVRDITGNDEFKDKVTGKPLYSRVYQIYADFTFQDGSSGSPEEMTVVKAAATDTAWQFIGSGTKAGIWFNPFAYQMIDSAGTTYKTGLQIDIEDMGNQGVNSARVEGPGLPADGVTLRKTSVDATQLYLDPQFQDNTVYWSSASYVMNDSQIAAIAASATREYTIKLYSSAAPPAAGSASGLIQTWKVGIKASPVANAALTSAYFPTFTLSGLTHAVSSYTPYLDKLATFSYTLPSASAYKTAWLSVRIELWSPWQDIEKDLALNKTTDSILVPTPSTAPTGGVVEISSRDGAKRQFETIWLFQ